MSAMTREEAEIAADALFEHLDATMEQLQSARDRGTPDGGPYRDIPKIDREKTRAELIDLLLKVTAGEQP